MIAALLAPEDSPTETDLGLERQYGFKRTNIPVISDNGTVQMRREVKTSHTADVSKAPERCMRCPTRELYVSLIPRERRYKPIAHAKPSERLTSAPLQPSLPKDRGCKLNRSTVFIFYGHFLVTIHRRTTRTRMDSTHKSREWHRQKTSRSCQAKKHIHILALL